MLNLFQAALAPIALCTVYIYIRDKYEKEPIRLLIVGLLYGAYSAAYIIVFGTIAEWFLPINPIAQNLYTAFITSAGIEETTKYIVLYFLVWKNKNFNEPFDGIVYAVFISLGFAMIENLIYVFDTKLGGLGTALSRAIFSVPGHGFFGVFMGYNFACAKFGENKRKYLFLAWFAPWIIHAVYNMILLCNFMGFMFIFIPFITFVWFKGLKKMKIHLANSPFK